MKIRIAIAEDNRKLGLALKESLNSFEEADVLFVAENGKALLHKIPSLVPDVVLMDINMPVMDGIEATLRLKRQFPAIKIIMLTVFDDDEKIFQSILSGASGYLLKEEDSRRIMESIFEVMDGGAPMTPLIAAKTLALLRRMKSEITENNFSLTKRELEILEMISRGNSYRQIAEKLFISPGTVRKHIENIYTKLQVHNKVEAINIAARHKLI